jgi:osmotically-inducible protein OsmY
MGWKTAFILGTTLSVACATAGSSRKGNLKVSDSWINTRAENEVKPVVSEKEQVSVTTQNGVVYLEGHVKDVQRAEELEQKVSDIRGVREVKNNLTVKP